jgi:glycerol uptake facilitator-like aquaporin
MIYISDTEQDKIKQKIRHLPSFLKGPNVAIVSFELVGTLIFAYGICAARYMHPIDKKILNPSYEFLISCFYYFALSVASPFSGGHLNPAVSIAFQFLRKDNKLKSYIFAQLLGALIGATIGKILSI